MGTFLNVLGILLLATGNILPIAGGILCIGLGLFILKNPEVYKDALRSF